MCAQHPKTVSFIPVIVALIASFRQHRLYDGFAGVGGGSAAQTTLGEIETLQGGLLLFQPVTGSIIRASEKMVVTQLSTEHRPVIEDMPLLQQLIYIVLGIVMLSFEFRCEID